MSKPKTHKVVRIDNLLYPGCEPHWKCTVCGECVPFHCWSKEEFSRMLCTGSNNEDPKSVPMSTKEMTYWFGRMQKSLEKQTGFVEALAGCNNITIQFAKSNKYSSTWELTQFGTMEIRVRYADR